MLSSNMQVINMRMTQILAAQVTLADINMAHIRPRVTKIIEVQIDLAHSNSVMWEKIILCTITLLIL